MIAGVSAFRRDGTTAAKARHEFNSSAASPISGRAFSSASSSYSRGWWRAIVSWNYVEFEVFRGRSYVATDAKRKRYRWLQVACWCRDEVRGLTRLFGIVVWYFCQIRPFSRQGLTPSSFYLEYHWCMVQSPA